MLIKIGLSRTGHWLGFSLTFQNIGTCAVKLFIFPTIDTMFSLQNSLKLTDNKKYENLQFLTLVINAPYLSTPLLHGK